MFPMKKKLGKNGIISKSIIRKKSDKDDIDIKKRDFIKKGFFGLLAGAAIGLMTKIPFVEGVQSYFDTTKSANSGTSFTIELSDGNVFDITLTGNCTFTFAGEPPTGRAGSFTVVLTQDGDGSRTATWPGSVDWAGGTAPTLTTTATTGVDVITFVTVDGGTVWLGFLSGGDMK